MQEPSTARVAVIIPHYNDVQRLVRCLAALVPQLGPADELVVADNDSEQDLGPVRDAFPMAKFVVQTEQGAGLARNLGVAATAAPWLMFIDADCIAAPDWIARGRQIARHGTVIGGRVDVFDETPPPRSGAEAFEQVFAFHMRAYFEQKHFLGAGNLILHRDVFAATGGFKSGVSEDVEWSRRAAAKGFRLAFDNAFAVRHPSRSDWAALRRKWRRLTAEEFRLRGSAHRLKWGIRALAMPPSIIAHIPKVLAHPDLRAGDKARALATLARIRFARMIWMLGQAVTAQP